MATVRESFIMVNTFAPCGIVSREITARGFAGEALAGVESGGI